MGEAPKIGALVLAAGLSRRFGGQKLLEQWCDRPVIWHAATAAMAGADEVVVLLGADAEEVAAALPSGCDTIRVERFAEGMSASLRAGMAEAARRGWDGAFVMLGDMPCVGGETLLEMREAGFRGPGSVLVPVHEGRRGNPVLWGAEWFDAFQELSGEEGGRHIMERAGMSPDEVEVGSEGIFFDVDTPEALQRLRTDPPPTA